MIKIIIHISLVLLFASQSFGQESKIKAADKKYEQFAYIDAIKIYEKVAEDGYKSVDLFQKLGNAYFFNGELEKANKWYVELFALNQEVEPEYYYRYSQTLKSVGDYEGANDMLDQFSRKSGNDLRAKLYEKDKNYLEEIKDNSGRFTIVDAGINSAFSDYGTSFLGNKLVFSSNREIPGTSKRIQKWNNQQFTRLFSSTVDADGNLGSPEEFSKSVNTKFNEATPVFTKDGKTMFFTRNNFNNGKSGKDSDKVILLKIYKATLENGEWTNITELPFNSNEYSAAHPALSLDEKTLYFSSDMPGTFGMSDLFQVSINADGTFGAPQNLGNKINTESRETFPFVSGDNHLYFSSDGRLGLGGLDVFVAKINGNTFGIPQNIGTPVNGKMDDFSFVIDNKTGIGFFSSNREGGLGFDDVYKFTEHKKLECTQLLAGTVTDDQTGEALANVKLQVFDENMNFVTDIIADTKGQYSVKDLKCGKTYYVRAEKKEYETKEQKAVLPKQSGTTDFPFSLHKNINKIDENVDIAKILGNIIIHFDLDKANIRPDAEVELAKIIAVMNQYPTLKVDVRSHTDSRQTKKYNDILSDKRAKSTVSWMIGKGIAADRLTGKGYGESQLLNKCSDGVDCSEAEHQVNRRSEFIVIKK